MSRREFLGLLVAALAALGLAGCRPQGDVTSTPAGQTGGPSTVEPPRTSQLPASTGYGTSVLLPGETSGQQAEGAPDLLVVEGAQPGALVEVGLAALGGISQFVKPGSRVVIKPNFSVPRTPAEAATTNPELVAAVVRQCLAAGAKEVKVIDFPFSGPNCLYKTGIKDAVDKAGGMTYNIDKRKYFEPVIVGGSVLHEVLFAKDVLEADVFINMPILKHHSLTKVTLGMKNMMGLVWDRGYFHKTDLHRGIAELAAYRKPDLIILDAIRGIINRGPGGPGTIREWNQIVIGKNPVVVDAYGASLFGLDPNQVGYIKEAARLGLGGTDLGTVRIQKIGA